VIAEVDVLDLALHILLVSKEIGKEQVIASILQNENVLMISSSTPFFIRNTLASHIVSSPLLSAFATTSKDSQVPEVSLEAIFMFQCLAQGVNRALPEVYDDSAVLADEMMVMPLVCGVIPDSPFPQIGLHYQSKALEQLQGTVYGGDVYLRIYCSDLRVDLLHTDMVVALVNGCYNHHALRRHAVTQFL